MASFTEFVQALTPTNRIWLIQQPRARQRELADEWAKRTALGFVMRSIGAMSVPDSPEQAAEDIVNQARHARQPPPSPATPDEQDPASSVSA